ncbi:kielin/chordin-like protein [Leguminivora glycinivorella]|uniref:kielin/chordin-like protein n=1 Tax=Leguminivora glycinivorella TaxID=1035111 RepID=UPI00200C0A69|nr:kielin/chordin-like protein [Leguminivora glycinivorella]
MTKIFLILSFLISGVLLYDTRICRTVRTRILNEGDHFEPHRCFFCECQNQTLSCKHQDPDVVCTEPPCDPAVQISASDRCCKICPGVGARCRFNGIPIEDGESFQLDPCGTCNCHDGKLTCSEKCPSE